MAKHKRIMLVADLNFTMMRRFIRWRYRHKSTAKLKRDLDKFKKHKLYQRMISYQ